MGFFGGGGGGSSAPGGVAGDTQVIFNDAGTLAGDGSLLYDKVGDRLLVGGPGPFTAGAILEVKSITGTLLLPRVTTTQRNAIGAPNGSILFNTDTGRLSLVAGSAWGELLNTNSGGDVDFTSGSFYFHAPVGGGFRGVNWISDAAGGGYAYLMSANTGGTTFLRTSVIGVPGFTPGLTEMLTQNYGGAQATRFLLYSGSSFSYAAIYATAGYWSGLVLGSSNQPDTTTALQLDSNYGALLLPRLTTAQRNAVALIPGKVVFNKDTAQLNYMGNAAWQSVPYNRVSGFFGLGAPYSPPNSIWSRCPMDTTFYDDLNARGAAGYPSSYQIQIAGTYMFTVRLYCPNMVTNDGNFGVCKNGAFGTPFVMWTIPHDTGPRVIEGVITSVCAVGEYIDVTINNWSGAVTFPIGSTWTVALIG